MSLIGVQGPRERRDDLTLDLAWKHRGFVGTTSQPSQRRAAHDAHGELSARADVGVVTPRRCAQFVRRFVLVVVDATGLRSARLEAEEGALVKSSVPFLVLVIVAACGP